MAFKQSQLDILERTSHISSAFSLAGASFIILTFCTSKRFHRPINRLAFFASFGNIITNVATIYSRAGIRAGQDSRLCQAQAAIIQWAIPADALFCLAMAFNVYLTVFLKKTTKQLKVLEPVYVVLCYGIPLVPSLVFLLLGDPSNDRDGNTKGKIYGPATLWCWIGNDWQVLRIAAFYGPVWIVLVITFFIYATAGRVIFALRENLRKFARERSSRDSGNQRTRDRRNSHCVNNAPPIEVAPGKIAVTTVDTVELTRVEDMAARSNEQQQHKRSVVAALFPAAFSRGGRTVVDSNILPEIASYTCTIEAVPRRFGVCKKNNSSGNNYNSSRLRSGNNAVEANTAAWAYCRCAMLFFLALVITWLPSSINRVYNLAEPDVAHFGLNFGAVLVLPAQGFWNGLIYVVTTFPACKEWFRDIGEQLNKPLAWFRENCLPRWRWVWGLGSRGRGWPGKEGGAHSLSSV